VQLELAGRRDRVLDCETCELVPKGDAAGLGREHPGGETFVEGSDVVSDQRLEQPELDLWGHDRHGGEDLLGRRAERRCAREHGVAHGVRNLVGLRCDRLDDEERVPSGLPVELVGVDVSRLRELRDSGR